MSKYVYLPQTDIELPLLDKELIYADISSIVFRSNNGYNIVNNLTAQHNQMLSFYGAVDSEGVYPRYNPTDYPYKVSPDPEISVAVKPDPNFKDDFDTLMYKRSRELASKLTVYDRVYMFWSGGIDSTVILTAILKNWSVEELKQLTVVCNQHSVDEYPNFYQRFVKDKLDTVSSDLFFGDKIKYNHNNIYIASDTGDVVIGYNFIPYFNQKFPGLYNKSYKKHSKELIEYFGKNDIGYYAYQRIRRSLDKNNIEVDTVFDFLWWIDFNWSFDQNLYYFAHMFSLLPEELDTRKFFIDNMFDWFKVPYFQQWAFSTIGTSLRIKDDILSFKYAYKKYIYDFDKDLDYFLYKTRESSIPKNDHVHHGRKVLAIDKDWTLYYR